MFGWVGRFGRGSGKGEEMEGTEKAKKCAFGASLL